MSSVLRIFRKDVRQLWLGIVGVVAIEFAAHWAQAAPTLGMARAQGGLGIGTLAQWFLIASVIHGEALVGDRQYWLTRPFSWKTLLAAKLLFVLVFIHLPTLAGDVSALILRGQSPGAHWLGLATAQFFTLEQVVGCAALASITASLVQLVWTSLAASLGYAAIGLMFSVRVGGNVSWGGLEWIHAAAIAVFIILGAVAILAVQYAARNTALSRWILMAGVSALILLMWMPGWHAAFALQTWLDGRRVPDSVARMGQDSPRGVEVDPLPHSQWGLRGPQPAVEFPIRITGVPPGMGVQSDRVAATAETANGRTRVSGWDPINRLSQVIGDEKTTREERLLPGDDTWLYLNVDPYSAGAERTLHASIALTLLSAEEITPLQAGGVPTRVPQGGLCWVMGTGNLSILCSWPAPTPGYAVIRISAMGMPTGFEMPLLSERLFGDLSYGPCSNTGGLWQIVTGNVVVSAEPSEILLVTRRAVAHFEREIEIHPGGRQLP
jgi:hypothetical protein